jgi:hypothetical protein
MGAPPQARQNAAVTVERDAKIFRLKLAGLTERQIAAEVELSQSRVNKIIAEQVADRISPVATEWADHRDAELADLFARSYGIIADPVADTGDRLKAIATCTRVNESRRKLRGVDAPEALSITHMANLDLSGDLVSDVIRTLIPAVAEAAGVDHGRRAELEAFAGELARWVLLGREGEQPVCPPARLAITAGTAERPPEGSAAGDGPPVPWTPGGDGAERVLSELAAFEDEFGPLGDGEEDDV